jgi:hypothetical protein
MMAEATFRETNGGVGPEIYDIAGKQNAAVSWYATCPAGNDIPPEVAHSWTQYWAGDRHASAPPFHAVQGRTWSHAEQGVVYRYTTYTLFFHGCDFWYNAHGGNVDHYNPSGMLDFDAKCDGPKAVSATTASTAKS